VSIAQRKNKILTYCLVVSFSFQNRYMSEIPHKTWGKIRILDLESKTLIFVSYPA